MAYDIFSKYGLDRVHDGDDCDWKDVDGCWKKVASKDVLDSDGFTTEYTWYTDGDRHIFMFGDPDIETPDPDYADWECETQETAQEWFDNYKGFEDSDEFEEDDFDDTPTGNSDFMNEAFDRLYNVTSIKNLNEKLSLRK